MLPINGVHKALRWLTKEEHVTRVEITESEGMGTVGETEQKEALKATNLE